MNNTKLEEIVTILRSIILQNQSKNIYESKMVNGLKFENNIISFTLELLPEQLKQSESIKKFIQEKLYVIDNVKKVDIILTSHKTKKNDAYRLWWWKGIYYIIICFISYMVNDRYLQS